MNMLKDKIIQFLENTELKVQPIDNNMLIIEKADQRSNPYDYYCITIDMQTRIMYDTYVDSYEEIGEYDCDDALITALSSVLNKVEIVLFARHNGECVYFKYTSNIEDYIKVLEERKRDLLLKGYQILASEFYSLTRIEPIIYDDSFNYNDIICCLNNIYDRLKNAYQYSKTYEIPTNRNIEKEYAVSIVTGCMTWERILGIEMEGYSGLSQINVGIEFGHIGNIFGGMYILAYPSDERAFAASPQLLETIKEQIDKKCNNRRI